MKPQYHVLLGSLAASALVPILRGNSLLFFVSSILIDADHYADYIYRNKFRDFSLKRMFIFHRVLFQRGRSQEFLSLNILHTLESLALVLVASEITHWAWLKAVLYGMAFHILVDAFYIYQHGRFFRRALSIIEYVIRWQRLKQKGLHPEEPYESALRETSASPNKIDDAEQKEQ